jgi:hypothetical protein
MKDLNKKDGEEDSYPNICCFIVDCCKSPAVNFLSNNIIIIRRVGRSKEKSLLLLPLFRCFFLPTFPSFGIEYSKLLAQMITARTSQVGGGEFYYLQQHNSKLPATIVVQLQ